MLNEIKLTAEYLRDRVSCVVHTCTHMQMSWEAIQSLWWHLFHYFFPSKNELFHTLTKKMKRWSLMKMPFIRCDQKRLTKAKLNVSAPSILIEAWLHIQWTVAGHAFCNLKYFQFYWKTALGWFLLGIEQHSTKDYITITGLNKRGTLRAMINSWRYSPFHTFMKDVTR